MNYQRGGRENMKLLQTLQRDADALTEKQIGLQSIHFRQGREIASTYVNMMISYARLDVQSGHYEIQGEERIVRGFCRIEEHHFDRQLLHRKRKQSFWTAQWSEEITLLRQGSDLFEAFCSSFAEFCEENGIAVGKLCALIRGKNGTVSEKPFPVTVTTPETLEAIGFPYEIVF